MLNHELATIGGVVSPCVATIEHLLDNRLHFSAHQTELQLIHTKLKKLLTKILNLAYSKEHDGIKDLQSIQRQFLQGWYPLYKKLMLCMDEIVSSEDLTPELHKELLGYQSMLALLDEVKIDYRLD